MANLSKINFLDKKFIIYFFLGSKYKHEIDVKFSPAQGTIIFALVMIHVTTNWTSVFLISYSKACTDIF